MASTRSVLARCVMAVVGLMFAGCATQEAATPERNAGTAPIAAAPLEPTPVAPAPAADEPAPRPAPPTPPAPVTPVTPVTPDGPPAATQPIDAGPAVQLPYSIERFQKDGPIAGVVARIDLSDPRVSVSVRLSDDRDPDGDGPAVGRLDTVSNTAQRLGLEIAMNASFFAVTSSQTVLGKKVGYFVGNGGFPTGWHYSNGKIYGRPLKPALRATMVVHNDGHVSLMAGVDELPPDTKYAVSGNAKILTAGQPTPPAADTVRHPRSAVGLTADGKTMILIVVDGRRPGWSRGVTLEELAVLMQSFGVTEAINLDGGGSSSLVVKDLVTGAFSVLNRPSEKFSLLPIVDEVERPVVDVVGVDLRD